MSAGLALTHAPPCRAVAIGRLAVASLRLELDTYPKPGLVSRIDSGSHADMDAATFEASAAALEPYFEDLAQAGADGLGMAALRRIGLEAEAAMRAATGGVNTHRGAIFGLGLLVAAAGALGAGHGPSFGRNPGSAYPLPLAGRGRGGGGAEGTAKPNPAPPSPPTPPHRGEERHACTCRSGFLSEPPYARSPRGALGAHVRARHAAGILAGPELLHAPGARARRRFRVGGAPAEAAAGFPSLYRVGLPALRRGRRLRPDDPNAARVEACLALIAALEDTNLLHRGGEAGLRFARASAAAFIRSGGVGRRDWRAATEGLHHAFVARRLSPGGAADLLAMTLFVAAVEDAPEEMS